MKTEHQGKTTTLTTFVYTLMLVAAVAAGADCPPCGPDFCHGDSRYPTLLAAKKQQLKNSGYPDDLVALLDRDGECVARIERAPDGFSIKIISSAGSTTRSWTKDEERIARDNLLTGKVDRFYKFNAARALACCGDKQPEDRPDWEPTDGVSRGQTIVCRKVGDAVQCK
jgi:hypothetical protein